MALSGVSWSQSFTCVCVCLCMSVCVCACIVLFFSSGVEQPCYATVSLGSTTSNPVAVFPPHTPQPKLLSSKACHVASDGILEVNTGVAFFFSCFAVSALYFTVAAGHGNRISFHGFSVDLFFLLFFPLPVTLALKCRIGEEMLA